MEMDMEFLRKLPTPKELKEQFPVSEKIAAIKEDRDRQIREIFEGEPSVWDTRACCISRIRKRKKTC